MVNCYSCVGKGEVKHLGRVLCKKCFSKIVERRIRKHLGRRLFKKGDRVLVVGEVEKILLERAVGGMPLEVVSRKRLPKSVKEFNCVVVGKTMDKVCGRFLERLFLGKFDLGKLEEKKFFNILEPLSDEEVKEYAKIKKIKFVVRKGRRSYFSELGNFEESKYNLYKNIRLMREKF